MNIQDIFKDPTIPIFIVTNSNSLNELEWEIEPTVFDLIPENEAIYYVQAKQVYADRSYNCYLSIITPERIAEIVIKINNGKIVAESVNDQDASIIPTVASVCYGDYNLYYARENPQIGIDILEKALATHPEIATIAEDLGYILRDEGRDTEALTAFHLAEKAGASSEYIYLEISRLYERIGDMEKHDEYQNLFAKT